MRKVESIEMAATKIKKIKNVKTSVGILTNIGTMKNIEADRKADLQAEAEAEAEAEAGTSLREGTGILEAPKNPDTGPDVRDLVLGKKVQGKGVVPPQVPEVDM